jgi:hypothetical protein
MPSSPSDLLLLQLMADGEDENSWGDNTNVNLQLLEQAIAGETDIVAGDTNITLTDTDYATDQARCRCISITGALTADILLIIPSRTKDYLVRDETTGDFTITVITAAAGATGVTTEQGSCTAMYCDGTHVIYVSAQGSTNATSLIGVPGADFAQLVQQYSDPPTDSDPTQQLWTGGQASAFVDLTDASTVTLNAALGNKFIVTIGGNRTLDITQPVDGQSIELWVVQDGAGSHTFTFPGNITFEGGAPVLDETAAHINIFKITYNAALTEWLGTADTNFSNSAVTSATINSSLTDTNVWQYLGSPSAVGVYNITIAAGVVCTSTSNLTPALDFTGFSSGSTVNLINNGYVLGHGGDGGEGASSAVCVSGGIDIPYALGGGDGQPGGPAIKGPGSGVTFNLTNANGFIWGGGGGGGGGGATGHGANSTGNGGGGGGGAGGGRGGQKGRANAFAADTSATRGDDAGSGPAGAFGAGGASSDSAGGAGGAGGPGGTWGAAGTDGVAVSTAIGTGPAPPGNSGVAGKAIAVNGGTVNFVSGAGAPHVMGNVA